LEHAGQVAWLGLSGANVALTTGCGSAAEIIPPPIDPTRWGTGAKLDLQLNFAYLRIDGVTSGPQPSGADIGGTITLTQSGIPDNDQACIIIAVHFDEQSSWVYRVVRADHLRFFDDGPRSVRWTMGGGREGAATLANVQNCLRVSGIDLASHTQVGDVGLSGAWKHYLALWGHPVSPDCNGVFRIVGALQNTAYVVHKLLTDGWLYNGVSHPPFAPDGVTLNWNEVIPLICGRFANSHEYRNLVISYWPGITLLLDGGWDLSSTYELENVDIVAATPDGFQPNGYVGSIPIVSETTFEVWYHNCTFVGQNGSPLWYLDDAGVVRPVHTSAWFTVNGASYANDGFNALHHFFKVNVSGGGITFTCRGPRSVRAQSDMVFNGLGVESLDAPGIFNVETRETFPEALRVEDAFSADAAASAYTVWCTYAIPAALDGVFSKCSGLVPNTGFPPSAAIDAFSDDSHSSADNDDWTLGGDPSGSIATAVAPRHFSLTDLGRTDAFLQGIGSSGGPTMNAIAPVTIPADPFDPDLTKCWTGLHSFPPTGLIVTRVRGPRGLMTAARLTASQANMSFSLGFGLDPTYNAVPQVGDMIIVGAWLRSADPAKGVQAGFNLQVVSIGSPGSVFDNVVGSWSPAHDQPVRRTGGGWRHWVSIGKCTREGAPGSYLDFRVGALPGRPIEIDEPFMVVVPASAGIPEDEVIRIYRHARYFRNGVPVGVSTIGRYEQYGIGEDLQLGRDVTSVPTDPAWRTQQAFDASSYRVAGTRVLRRQDTDVVHDVITVPAITIQTLTQTVQRLINIVKWHGLSKVTTDPRYIFDNLLWFVRGQDDAGNLACVDAGDGTALAWTDLTGQNVLRAVQSGAATARPNIIANAFNGKTFLEGDGSAKCFDCGAPTMGNLSRLTVFGVMHGQVGFDVPDYQNIMSRGYDVGGSWQIASRHAGGGFNGVIEAIAIAPHTADGAATYSNGNSYDGEAHRFVYSRDDTRPTIKGTINVGGVGPQVDQTIAGQIRDVANHVGIFASLNAAGAPQEGVGDFARVRLGELGLILGTPSTQELTDYMNYCQTYYGSAV
jgi:hypothetical protein